MARIYDYVIVGAGISGISFAQCLLQAQPDINVLILEKDSVIGGCHAVHRINGMFTEHAPRVISSTYLTFFQLLEDLGINPKELYTEYLFSINSIATKGVSHFNAKEIASLTKSFFGLMLSSASIHDAKCTSMLEYGNTHNFSSEAQRYIDLLCRLTDGAGSDRYSVFQFLQLVNQQAFHILYQPRYANDDEKHGGLFPRWIDAINSKWPNKLTILCNSQLKKIIESPTNLKTTRLLNSSVIITSGAEKTSFVVVQSKNIVLAVPPQTALKILNNSASPQIKNAFGQEFVNLASLGSYEVYIPITFHWKEKYENLKRVHGFPFSDFGIAFIVTSDYMAETSNTESGTIISIVVTLLDSKSSKTGKTANQCNEKELINEVYRQLSEVFEELSQDYIALMPPGTKYNSNSKKWSTSNSAFIQSSQLSDATSTITAGESYFPFQSNIVPGLYNLGSHNGHSKYSFTSMESAASNAVALAKEIFSKNQSLKFKYEIKYSNSIIGTMTLRDFTNW